MPKMTLLEMTQNILASMDGENVNSISDTEEAIQVATFIKDTFYNITTNRNFPEHFRLFKLVAFSDNNYPTSFYYGEEMQDVASVQYKVGDDETEWREIKYLAPADFLRITDARSEFVLVNESVSGTLLKIDNTTQPTYYTSFDNNSLVMDAYDAAVDTTLQESKTRAHGRVIPSFSLVDNFVPELNANNFPLLLNESKSVAMSLLIGGADPKVEQAARRQRARNQNNRYKTNQPQGLSIYGRN